MNKLYTETLLYLFPKIDARINCINEKSIKLGFGSMRNKIFESIELMYQLCKEKFIYMIIKNAINVIKNRLSVQQINLLEYKYFRNDNMILDKDFDHTSRNYFRRQNALLKRFSESFELLDFTNEFFEKECLKYKFISALLNNVQTGEIKYVRNYER